MREDDTRTDHGDDRDMQPAPDDAPAAGGRPGLLSRGCGWLGCLLAIGLLVALGAGVFALGNALEPLADRYLWGPHEVVRHYFDAWRREDRERAAHFQCAGVTQPLDPMRALGSRVGAPYVDDEFAYPRPADRVAIYYRAQQNGPRAQALLEREDEGWRICQFVE